MVSSKNALGNCISEQQCLVSALRNHLTHKEPAIRETVLSQVMKNFVLTWTRWKGV